MPPRRHSSTRAVGFSLAAAGPASLGCGGYEAPLAPEGGLPLPDVELPLLACAERVPQEGECERDRDCGEGQRCVLSRDTTDREPVVLSCEAPIGILEERSRCEQGSECETGLCGLAGVCMRTCAEHDDCATGQLCQRIEVRVDGGLSPVMACARSAAFAPDVKLHGTKRIDGLEPERRNNVEAPGAVGSSLLFLKLACGETASVQSLRSRADGRELFDLQSLLDGRLSPNPVANSGALVPMLIPNNPEVSASGRGYDLSLAVSRAGSADFVVASRERASGPTLDLNVFYVGGGEGVRRGGFHPGDSEPQQVLERLRKRCEAFGIELGHVREYDVVGSLRDELSVPTVAEDPEVLGTVEELFQLSAGVDDGGINVFFVSDMGEVLGVSGGIPGALGVHGTGASGVAVALDAAGLSRADGVLMHEISHQMGLFHTSELDGFVIEPLEDTPECDAGRDRNGDGFVSASECSGRGADNLMFWSGTGDELSEQQLQVLKSSLVLR